MDKLSFVKISECIKDTSKILNTDETVIVKSLLDSVTYSDIINRYIKDKEIIDFFSEREKLPLENLKKIMINNLHPEDVILLCSVNKYFKDKVCGKTFWRIYIKEKFKIDAPITLNKKDLINLIKTYKFFGTTQIEPTHKDLITAIETDNILIVKFLLNDSRINPAEQNNEAIRIASEKGYYGVTKLLLADPRVDPSGNDNWAIIDASMNGHISVVELLLADKRVDPTDRDNAAFYWAYTNNHYEVVKLLLNWGKDLPIWKRVNPSYYDNKQAIIHASKNGNYEMLKLLLEDTRIDPSYNYNKAIVEATIEGHYEIVKLLLEDSRVDPTDDGNIAIIKASKLGHYKIVELLLDWEGSKETKRGTKIIKVDPTVDDNYAIRSASKNGHYKIIKLLLDWRGPSNKRVDPSAKDNSAIRLAGKNGHTKVVNLLLKDKRVSSSYKKQVVPTEEKKKVKKTEAKKQMKVKPKKGDVIGTEGYRGLDLKIYNGRKFEKVDLGEYYPIWDLEYLKLRGYRYYLTVFKEYEELKFDNNISYMPVENEFFKVDDQEDFYSEDRYIKGDEIKDILKMKNNKLMLKYMGKWVSLNKKDNFYEVPYPFESASHANYFMKSKYQLRAKISKYDYLVLNKDPYITDLNNKDKIELNIW